MGEKLKDCTRSITQFRKNLRGMNVGDELSYMRKKHNSYLATASYLKAKGEGVWMCTCSKFDREGVIIRLK